jgi:predicted kinase
MSRVLFGIGAPGAGKTTALKDFVSREVPEAVYISLDDIREELTGDPGNQACSGAAWGLAYGRLERALGRGRDVIFDATMAKRRDRRQLIKKCRRAGAVIVAGIWFNPPLEVCLGRNGSRERKIPDDEVRRIYRDLVQYPPIFGEGYDTLNEVTE